MVVILNEKGECILCEFRNRLWEIRRFVEKRGSEKLREAFQRIVEAWKGFIEVLHEECFGTYVIEDGEVGQVLTPASLIWQALRERE